MSDDESINNSFRETPVARGVFWVMFLLSVVMMVVAVYYQYYLDMAPCAECVRIRAMVVLMGVIGLVFALSPPRVIITSFITHLISMGVISALGYIGYGAYLIESGQKISLCSMSNPFPEVYPLHEWFPLIFEAKGPCGVSPELFFGVTMIEALLATLLILFVYAGISLCRSLFITINR